MAMGTKGDKGDQRGQKNLRGLMSWLEVGVRHSVGVIWGEIRDFLCPTL